MQIEEYIVFYQKDGTTVYVKKTDTDAVKKYRDDSENYMEYCELSL